MIRRWLNRLEGILKLSGMEVLVFLKSLEGNVNFVIIFMFFFIIDRILYNKIVYFFLGFIWLGFKVFDVLFENRYVDKMYFRKYLRL